MKIDTVFDCPRCLATGKIDAFSHVKGGICFLCGGDKQITRDTSYRRPGLVLFYTKAWYWGHRSDDHAKPEWLHKHLVNLSFDSGNSVEVGFHVDENPSLARAVYRWAIDAGAKVVKQVDENRLAPDRRPKLKSAA